MFKCDDDVVNDSSYLITPDRSPYIPAWTLHQCHVERLGHPLAGVRQGDHPVPVVRELRIARR